MKRVVKILAVVLGGLLTVVALHVLLVVFPHPLLRHRVSHQNYTVRSPERLPPEIYSVLDRTRSLLAASTINDEEMSQTVYLLNSYRLMRFLLIRNVHFGCVLGTGDIYITDADVARDVARCKKLGPRDMRRRSLSGAITHEATHRLIRRHVGLRKALRLPTWVKEGYCDFIAHENAIDPTTGFAILDGRTSGRAFGFAYFEYRLVIAYLLIERGMTIEMILEQPPDYGAVVNEAISWSRENREQILADWLGDGPTIVPVDP